MRRKKNRIRCVFGRYFRAKFEAKLMKGEPISDIRRVVQQDFGVETKGQTFELLKNTEKEMKNNVVGPITVYSLNEIREANSKNIN